MRPAHIQKNKAARFVQIAPQVITRLLVLLVACPAQKVRIQLSTAALFAIYVQLVRQAP